MALPPASNYSGYFPISYQAPGNNSVPVSPTQSTGWGNHFLDCLAGLSNNFIHVERDSGYIRGYLADTRFTDDIKLDNILDLTIHLHVQTKTELTSFIWHTLQEEHGDRLSDSNKLEIRSFNVDPFGSMSPTIEEKRKVIISAAERGRKVAQYYCWHARKELGISETIAFSNLKESAAQGYPFAIKALATTPFGIAQNNFLKAIEIKISDPGMSLKLLQQSASAGNLDAQLELGRVFTDKKDYSEAIKYYKMAKDSGYNEATLKMADVYNLQYRQSQFKLGGFSISFSFSSPLADALNLYSEYLKSRNPADAILAKRQCLELQADAGFKECQRQLGEYYIDGRIDLAIRPDIVKAEKYLLLAANNGDGIAAFLLFLQYERSKFPAADSQAMSSKYLKMAADLGNKEAVAISEARKKNAPVLKREVN